MIVQCDICKIYFDDQFRNTDCPHDTFMVNDGQNNFKHYPKSWLSDRLPSKERFANMTDKSENTKYNEWLEANKVKNGR